MPGHHHGLTRHLRHDGRTRVLCRVAWPRCRATTAAGATTGELCPASAVICEDFEDGNLDGWTQLVTGGTLAIDSAHAANGTSALSINIPANQRGGFIERTGAPLFPLPGKAMWGRVMVYFDSVSDGHTDVVRGAPVGGGTPWYNVGEQHGEILLNYYDGAAADCWARPSPGRPVAAADLDLLGVELRRQHERDAALDRRAALSPGERHRRRLRIGTQRDLDRTRLRRASHRRVHRGDTRHGRADVARRHRRRHAGPHRLPGALAGAGAGDRHTRSGLPSGPTDPTFFSDRGWAVGLSRRFTTTRSLDVRASQRDVGAQDVRCDARHVPLRAPPERRGGVRVASADER